MHISFFFSYIRKTTWIGHDELLVIVNILD